MIDAGVHTRQARHIEVGVEHVVRGVDVARDLLSGVGRTLVRVHARGIAGSLAGELADGHPRGNTRGAGAVKPTLDVAHHRPHFADIRTCIRGRDVILGRRHVGRGHDHVGGRRVGRGGGVGGIVATGVGGHHGVILGRGGPIGRRSVRRGPNVATVCTGVRGRVAVAAHRRQQGEDEQEGTQRRDHVMVLAHWDLAC